MRFLLVCLGGALGSGARYLLAGWMALRFGGNFPFGILLVNVLGSFALGCVMTLALRPPVMTPDLRVFLTTGVLGGFTTYSSFNYDALHFLAQGHIASSALYIGVTVLGCLASGWAGVVCARMLAGA